MLNEFITQNITLVMALFIAISFLLAVCIVWWERKVFLKELKNINKITYILLLVLIIGLVIFCGLKGLNFKSFQEVSHEWEAFGQAKELVLGDKKVFNHIFHGLVYPLLLATGFKLFGFNPLVASVLNLILAVFSIFLVFLLSKIIFKKDSIGLISAFIYALNPLFFSFTAYQMGEPTTIGFFLLLVMVAGILAFQHHKINLHLLTLLFITLAAQTRLEYFILIIPYMFCFLFFKEYKNVKLLKFALIILLFLFLSIPVFALNSRLKDSYESGWAGFSQAFWDGQEYHYSLPLVDELDKILKPLTNNSFSFNYMVYDIPNFYSFWSSKYFWLISIFTIIGVIFSFKKYKKEWSFVLLTFLFLSWVYLASTIFYEPRFAISTFALVVIFAGFAVSLISNKIGFFFKQPVLMIVSMIILLTLLVLSPTFNFVKKRILFFSRINIMYFSDDYNNIKNLVEGISLDNSIFIASTYKGRYTMILRFLGYQADFLGDGKFLGLAYHQRSISEEEFFKKIKFPFDWEKDNYLIIDTENNKSPLDKFVLNNYSLELVEAIENNKLYYIQPK